MWISKSKYNAKLEAIEELEKETRRLANLVTEKTEDCQMGPWCKDCAHRGTDSTNVRWDTFNDMKFEEYGRVYYCKKHLHEICPEFEAQKYVW